MARTGNGEGTVRTRPAEVRERPAPAAMPREVAQASAPALPFVRVRYFFTITCELAAGDPPPVEIPGGTRLQLSYLPAGSEVSSEPARFAGTWGRTPQPGLANATDDERKQVEELLDDDDGHRPGIVAHLEALCRDKRALLDREGLPWPGIEGSVRSGVDSVLVREDGVMAFDGRVTIEASSGFLVDLSPSGLVDLRSCLDVATGKEAYAAYRAGSAFPPQDQIPVQLALRFEAAQEPGENAEFAARRYVLQGLNHWNFERLVRGQFIGLGTVEVQRKPCWPARRITLHVYEVESFDAEGDRPWIAPEASS